MEKNEERRESICFEMAWSAYKVYCFVDKMCKDFRSLIKWNTSKNK